MNNVASLEYYPQYCFHLSPTISKWCPLRATDIAGLSLRAGFEGQDIFFYLNHPIRWVRITGVVVAIDEYERRRIYTIDDSTGECIECCLDIPKPSSAESYQKSTASTNRQDGAAGTAADPPPLPPPSDIDVGTVVDVKGGLGIFREHKQIRIRQLQKVASTDVEVQFWNKIRAFRKSVLGRPWALDGKVVRECRRLQESEADGEERRHARKDRKKKKKQQQQQQHQRAESRATDRAADDGEAISNLGTKRHKSTREKEASKAESSRTYYAGQYRALGL
ncbi:hypothetical protein GGR56DRAFT_425382 [Xylariaceae sp. FL0804]|nr:hypothetical protein GGR56DRAFT_425382 [Xylariaceae sp. FL0804]